MERLLASAESHALKSSRLVSSFVYGFGGGAYFQLLSRMMGFPVTFSDTCVICCSCFSPSPLAPVPFLPSPSPHSIFMPPIACVCMCTCEPRYTWHSSLPFYLWLILFHLMSSSIHSSGEPLFSMAEYIHTWIDSMFSLSVYLLTAV